jgi:cyclic nucleotide gated channel
MVRLEEWRTKRTDMERWMHHRQIPQPLRQCVRRYHQYKWVATRGVNEEALLSDLPMDIRRDIKRHLCLDLVRRVRGVFSTVALRARVEANELTTE